jgi:uncharacterized delta-60 repeat protein
VTTRFTDRSSDEAHAVAIQSDGRIVAAGESFPTASSSSDLAVARYTPGGKLDTTFSGDGRARTDIAPSGDDSANVVSVQGNGKIVAAGFSRKRFALIRYTARGGLDTTFSGDGKVTTGFADTSTDDAEAVSIQADGKVVAAGNSFLSFDRFALARSSPTGVSMAHSGTAAR